ncbi:LGFP repeat-containing protein [Litorihabitans aurantiacus]|uniref:Cellulose biosynthesis protein BcsS n=1 Tax=Litorihabitans aurantiacus TaxID=1930061 RepID=A0AA38CU78_9MICO|nr:hypothetical protein [Litorihabitans aurantiacus]GMA31930.1 hypothetical protein GCM10025875_19220 [Litorihabitans aurantiacus]
MRRTRSALRTVTTAVAALALTASLGTAAQADTYTWDASGYGWRVIENGHQYTSPFGTHAVQGSSATPEKAFSVAHLQLGGGRGVLGYPTSTSTYDDIEQLLFETAGYSGVGQYQQFERGVIYGLDAERTDGTPVVNTSVVRGGTSPFRSVHAATGGGTGALGYPLGNEVRQASGYWYQPFLGGQIYVSPRGAFPVDSRWGGFDYTQRGGGTSDIGYPVGNLQIQGLDHAYQRFERGIMYTSLGCWGCDTGLVGWAVKGGFLEAHAARGGGTGSLGYPKGNEFFDTTTRTWSQVFERGRIHIGPAGTRYEMGVFWEL